MSCEKHKLRKRQGCPECFPGSTTDVVEDVQPKVTLSKETISTINDIKASIEGHPSPNLVGSPRIEEGKYIRVLVEAEIQKAIAKVRAEMHELKTIQWEHMHIPLATFCLDLMYALEKDGWKYCDLVRNPKQYGYVDPTDFVIFQRIKRKDNPPAPDFTKTGAAKRYMDKKNEKQS